MKAKWIASPCVAAALALAPATRAAADAGDAIAGAIIGGIIGSAITKDQMKKKQTRTYSKSSSGPSAAQRTQNREVQTALNHFGYPVGAPDGVLGAKSRSAISQYQVLLGYPPTGQLTEYERTLLVTAYHRAIAGGPQTMQIAAGHPMGMRGLLLVQRDEMAGVPSTGMGAMPGMMAAAPGMGATGMGAMGFAAGAGVAAAGTMAPALPEAVPAAPAAPALPDLGGVMAAAEPAAPALPSFMGGGQAQVSLASHCNRISLQTNSNGGYVTVASMTDPSLALGEQFCIARTYAMATGDEMVSKVSGFTPQQVAEQCQAFGPVLKDQVAALSVKPRDQALEGATAFVMTSGMAPAQMAATARICLGVGYTTDAMDVAVGSALILTALGEKGYAELLGHHLAEGFGTAARPDLAAEWYGMGLEAADRGQAVFAPGLPERNEVIRKAVFTMGGKAEAQPAPTLPVLMPSGPSATTIGAAAEPSMAVTPGQAMSAAARLPLMLFGQ